jgi:hypothetical protein
MKIIEIHNKESNDKLIESIIYNEHDLEHLNTVSKDEDIFSFVDNNFKRKSIDPLYSRSTIDFGQLTDEEFSKINSYNEDAKLFKNEYRYNLLKCLKTTPISSITAKYPSLSESDLSWYYTYKLEREKINIDNLPYNKSEISLINGYDFRVKSLDDFYKNEYISQIKNSEGFVRFVYEIYYWCGSYKFFIKYIDKYLQGFNPVATDNSGYIATNFTRVFTRDL